MIKIIKHSQFNIEFDSEKKTVQDLKNEIEMNQGFDVSQAKLLFNGKMLENSKLLQEYNIKEGNTIVVMNAKPKGIASTIPKVEPKKELEKKEETKKMEDPKNEIFEKMEEPEKKEVSEKKEEQKKNVIPEEKEEKGSINIIIKIIKHSQFNIRLNPEKKTVQDLKNEIEMNQGFDVSQAKLLFNGKMLENSKLLQEYNIKEGNTIVVMNAKPKGNASTIPKVEPKKEVEKKEEPKKNEIFEKKEEPKKNIIPEKKEEPKLKEELDKEVPKKIEEPEKREEQPKKVKLQPKNSNSDYSNQINTLIDMGYEREDVEKAVNAAKGNINLAIEYLNSDIEYVNSDEPEPNSQMQIQVRNQNQIQQARNRNLPMELKRNASFIKCICKDDPNIVLSILTYIKHKNPVLMDRIKEFEAEFKNFLVSPISQEDIDNFNLIKDSYREMVQRGVRGMPDLDDVELTEEDIEAIKRLKELGNFSDDDVIAAYIYCKKNEELAANCLFEVKMMREGKNQNNNNNQ